MEVPGRGSCGDTCLALTISFSAQSVVGLTVIANRVLRKAIFNLRGLWTAVICKEK